MPCSGRILLYFMGCTSAQRRSLGYMFLTVLITCRCSVLGQSLYRWVTVAQSVRGHKARAIVTVCCVLQSPQDFAGLFCDSCGLKLLISRGLFQKVAVKVAVFFRC